MMQQRVESVHSMVQLQMKMQQLGGAKRSVDGMSGLIALMLALWVPPMQGRS